MATRVVTDGSGDCLCCGGAAPCSACSSKYNSQWQNMSIRVCGLRAAVAPSFPDWAAPFLSDSYLLADRLYSYAAPPDGGTADYGSYRLRIVRSEYSTPCNPGTNYPSWAYDALNLALTENGCPQVYGATWSKTFYFNEYLQIYLVCDDNNTLNFDVCYSLSLTTASVNRPTSYDYPQFGCGSNDPDPSKECGVHPDAGNSFTASFNVSAVWTAPITSRGCNPLRFDAPGMTPGRSRPYQPPYDTCTPSRHVKVSHGGNTQCNDPFPPAVCLDTGETAPTYGPGPSVYFGELPLPACGGYSAPAMAMGGPAVFAATPSPWDAPGESGDPELIEVV